MTDLNKYEQITEISFDDPGAHLALTHKLQGYSANNKPQPLLIKSETLDIPEEAQEILKAISKGGDVQVTLSMQEFLQRFFGVYGSDAEVLARVLGYEKSPEVESYEEYLKGRVESVRLLKSAHESQKTTAEGFVLIQKALEREKLIQKDSHTEGDHQETDAAASVEKTPSDGDITKMTTEVTKEIEAQTALIKAQAEQLEKANARVAALEKAEAERIEKSYVAMVKTFSFIKSEDQVTLAKAILSINETSREAVVTALEKAQDVIKQYVTKEEGYETENDGKVDVNKTRSLIDERIAQKYKNK